MKSVGYLGTRTTLKKDKDKLMVNKERDGDDTIRTSRVRRYAGIPASSMTRPDPPNVEVMNRDL